MRVQQHHRCSHKKQGDFEMEAFSLTPNISGNSWSNLAIKDSFEISSSWGFPNQPWLLHKVLAEILGFKEKGSILKFVKLLLRLKMFSTILFQSFPYFLLYDINSTYFNSIYSVENILIFSRMAILKSKNNPIHYAWMYQGKQI